MSAQVNFVVALNGEAHPIIEYFRLQALESPRGVKCYARDHIRLTISGVGKIASATAVGYAAASTPGDNGIWINIGIAGHPALSLGTSVIAHEIVDVASGRSSYPAIVYPVQAPTRRVNCYEQVHTDYTHDALSDMESSGFFSAAARFATVEFIQVLKVVSDNQASHLQNLDRQRISGLIEENLDTIATLVSRLARLHNEHQPRTPRLPGGDLSAQWHFTATQSYQLEEIARRWAALGTESAWPRAELRRCTDARAVLKLLSATLAQLESQHDQFIST